MNSPADAADAVNPHLLDRMVAAGATRAVEVTEDIVASNGVKLLAKGARIDPAMRERLLEHKLRKPLEQCVNVADAGITERLRPLAEELLDRHALLAALCAPARAQPVPESLSKLRLTPPLLSLLTLYGECPGDRIAHCVGVAMLALALARRLGPGDIERQRQLATAGLLHDIGELYIDPAYLQRGARLEPEHWRHIVTHPLVGHRVLAGIDGAGPAVADAVLQHHERLDGFGYPRGIVEVSAEGQILGAAEWLMALIESGVAPVERASVAIKLLPGEFGDPLLAEISAAASTSNESLAIIATATPLEDEVGRVERIAGTMQRFAEARAWIDEQIAGAEGETRRALETGLGRMLRIRAALARTGLDTEQPGLLLRELAALNDPHLHLEVMTVIGELEWRLRELERETLLRAALLPGSGGEVLRSIAIRLRGAAPAGADAA